MASTPHSNAFNFLSFLQHQVDPRTGQYTAAISVPEINANRLCGPTLPLSLIFNPLSSLNQGFGPGWSWQLSHYDIGTSILTLNTGETLKVIDWDGPKAIFHEQKLITFNFYRESATSYRVAHNSGLTEILVLQTSRAMPVKQYTPQGHELSLTYESWANGSSVVDVLNCVYDAENQVLFEVNDIGSHTLTVKLYPHLDSYNCTYLWDYVPGSFETFITLPTEDKAQWRFRYKMVRDFMCISEVTTPNGAKETIVYGDEGHGHPADANLRLPRVTAHTVSPGSSQPDIVTHYSYVLTDASNKHNFLGYQGPGIIWLDNGLDNLYQVFGEYNYGSIQTIMSEREPIISTERTYNRFHLLTQELTRQDDNVSVVNTLYHLRPDRNFSDQPRNFQCPRIISKLWYLNSDNNTMREESERLEFDMHGNITYKLLADGISEVSTYYLAEGEGQPTDDLYCPAHPEGFAHSLKTKKLIPAPSDYGNAPTLLFQFCYNTVKSLNPLIPDSIVQVSERRLHVTTEPDPFGRQTEVYIPLQSIELNYYDTPENLLTHGRLNCQTIHVNQHVRSIHFEYAEGTDEQGQPYLETRQTTTNNSDATSRHWLMRASYLSGQTIFLRDEHGVESVYLYDALGRKTYECIAPNTEFSATQNISYSLAVAEGLVTEQIITDARGVMTRLLFDGSNRVIFKERLNTNSASGSSDFRKTYSARYDCLGHLIEETHYDWIDESNSLDLTTLFIYDDWSQLIGTIGPDGVQHYEVMDPIGLRNSEGLRERTVTQWTQVQTIPIVKQGLTRSRLSAMSKPLAIEQFDADENIVGLYEYRYDGIGNCVTEIDMRGHETHFTYDALSRLISNLLPDLTHVQHTYAAHSNDTLLAKIEVDTNGKPRAVLGTLVYDGIDRITESRVGRRRETRVYKDSQYEVSERKTLKNVPISYEYNFNLTVSPVRTTADEEAEFEYDKTTALLARSANSEGTREYTYNDAYQLKEETWSDRSGNVIHTQFTSSLLGRQLSRVETINGITSAMANTTYQYDDKGRMSRMVQGVLEANFTYDPFGRLHTTTTKDTHATETSVLQTTLEYDFMGREVKRSMSLNDQPLRVITQTWDIQGLLESRHLQLDEKTLLKETFAYDSRNRLTEFYCEGESLPTDDYGQAIVMQIFEFDGLDNITLSLTLFDDDSQDFCSFSYHPDDPCQLLSVSHSHPRYVADGRAFCEFTFDEDGHQLNDEFGNLLKYDSLGRLLRAEDESTGALVSSYRYDSHNQLIASQQKTETECLRMYEGLQLAGTLQDSIHTQLFRNTDRALGQQRSNNADQTLLFMTDANRSVIAQCQQETITSANYNAYGETGDWQLDSMLAFNGEAREPGSGWYLLGKGYRAYNPSLKRFHSPDSYSPFSVGGFNPYVYCLGNPLRFRDPTGHYSYGQQLDPGNPMYARTEPIAGFNWLGVLVIAAGTAITAAITIATWGTGTAAVIAVIATAIDLIGAGLSFGAMNNRGKASKLLDDFSNISMIPFFPGMFSKSAASAAKGALDSTATVTARSSVASIGTSGSVASTGTRGSVSSMGSTGSVSSMGSRGSVSSMGTLSNFNMLDDATLGVTEVVPIPDAPLGMLSRTISDSDLNFSMFVGPRDITNPIYDRATEAMVTLPSNSTIPTPPPMPTSWNRGGPPPGGWTVIVHKRIITTESGARNLYP